MKGIAVLDGTDSLSACEKLSSIISSSAIFFPFPPVVRSSADRPPPRGGHAKSSGAQKEAVKGRAARRLARAMSLADRNEQRERRKEG